MRSIHCNEEGLTLIELLIIIGIISILAAIAIPNLLGFLPAAKLANANTEVASVKTAALAYYAEMHSWPNTSDDLMGTIDYLDKPPDAIYQFDPTIYYVYIDSAIPGTGYTSTLSFNASTQQWER